MILLIYLLGGAWTLYSFYKSKNFQDLLFLPLLGASYFASQASFQKLSFPLRFLVFLIALVSTVAILYNLKENYRQARIDYRRRVREEKKEEMFHVEHSPERVKKQEEKEDNEKRDLAKKTGLEDQEKQTRAEERKNKETNLEEKEELSEDKNPSSQFIEEETEENKPLDEGKENVTDEVK